GGDLEAADAIAVDRELPREVGRAPREVPLEAPGHAVAVLPHSFAARDRRRVLVLGGRTVLPSSDRLDASARDAFVDHGRVVDEERDDSLGISSGVEVEVAIDR